MDTNLPLVENQNMKLNEIHWLTQLKVLDILDVLNSDNVITDQDVEVISTLRNDALQAKYLIELVSLKHVDKLNLFLQIVHESDQAYLLNKLPFNGNSLDMLLLKI